MLFMLSFFKIILHTSIGLLDFYCIGFVSVGRLVNSFVVAYNFNNPTQTHIPLCQDLYAL